MENVFLVFDAILTFAICALYISSVYFIPPFKRADGTSYRFWEWALAIGATGLLIASLFWIWT